MLANKIMKAIKSREFFGPTYDYIHRHTVARLIAFPALKPNQATPPNRPQRTSRTRRERAWKMASERAGRIPSVAVADADSDAASTCHLPLAACRLAGK